LFFGSGKPKKKGTLPNTSFSFTKKRVFAFFFVVLPPGGAVVFVLSLKPISYGLCLGKRVLVFGFWLFPGTGSVYSALLQRGLFATLIKTPSHLGGHWEDFGGPKNPKPFLFFTLFFFFNHMLKHGERGSVPTELLALC